MARPCEHTAERPNPACRICYWCLSLTPKGRKYRATWGEPEPMTAANPEEREMLKRLSPSGRYGIHVISNNILQGYREYECKSCEFMQAGRCQKTGEKIEELIGWEYKECPIGKW